MQHIVKVTIIESNQGLFAPEHKKRIEETKGSEQLLLGSSRAFVILVCWKETGRFIIRIDFKQI